MTFSWRFSAITSCCPAKSFISVIACLNALQVLYLKQKNVHFTLMTNLGNYETQPFIIIIITTTTCKDCSPTVQPVLLTLLTRCFLNYYTRITVLSSL
jgi:hypothetical protein